jgi:hypothetical protein
MAGADVAGVDLVIVEIVGCQQARFRNRSIVFGDARGIELHLHLLRPSRS